MTWLPKFKACELSVSSEKTEFLCKFLYMNDIEKDMFLSLGFFMFITILSL